MSNMSKGKTQKKANSGKGYTIQCAGFGTGYFDLAANNYKIVKVVYSTGAILYRVLWSNVEGEGTLLRLSKYIHAHETYEECKVELDKYAEKHGLILGDDFFNYINDKKNLPALLKFVSRQQYK